MSFYCSKYLQTRETANNKLQRKWNARNNVGFENFYLVNISWTTYFFGIHVVIGWFHILVYLYTPTRTLTHTHIHMHTHALPIKKHTHELFSPRSWRGSLVVWPWSLPRKVSSAPALMYPLQTWAQARERWAGSLTPTPWLMVRNTHSSDVLQCVSICTLIYYTCVHLRLINVLE